MPAKHWRLWLGLFLFFFAAAFVFIHFNTNADGYTLLFIILVSLSMFICRLLLKNYEEWFSPKKKLLLALLIFVAALVEMLVFSRRNVMGDGFIILLFLVIAILCNVWFSKWNKDNIPLLPHLGFALCDMAVLILSSNLAADADGGTQSLLSIAGILFALLALPLEHFILLKKEEGHTGKRLALSLLLSIMLWFGLMLLVIVKAFAT